MYKGLERTNMETRVDPASQADGRHAPSLCKSTPSPTRLHRPGLPCQASNALCADALCADGARRRCKRCKRRAFASINEHSIRNGGSVETPCLAQRKALG